MKKRVNTLFQNRERITIVIPAIDHFCFFIIAKPSLKYGQRLFNSWAQINQSPGLKQLRAGHRTDDKQLQPSLLVFDIEFNLLCEFLNHRTNQVRIPHHPQICKVNTIYRSLSIISQHIPGVN